MENQLTHSPNGDRDGTTPPETPQQTKIGQSPLIQKKFIVLSVLPRTIGDLYQTSPNGPDHFTLSLYLTAPP